MMLMTIIIIVTIVGAREQLNQLTSFLDASQIYGSSTQETSDLRDLTPGKLQIKTNNYYRVTSYGKWALPMRKRLEI